MDDLVSRTGAQFDALRCSRADLETFQQEIRVFHTSRAEITEANVQLAANRSAFERLVLWVDDFQQRVPGLGLESKMDANTANTETVDAQTQQAAIPADRFDDPPPAADGHGFRLDLGICLPMRVSSAATAAPLPEATSPADRGESGTSRSFAACPLLPPDARPHSSNSSTRGPSPSTPSSGHRCARSTSERRSPSDTALAS